MIIDLLNRADPKLNPISPQSYGNWKRKNFKGFTFPTEETIAANKGDSDE